MQPSLSATATPLRQLGLGALLGKRLQIARVLLEHGERTCTVEHRSVARHDVLGASGERAQPIQRGEIGLEVSSAAECGQLDR